MRLCLFWTVCSGCVSDSAQDVGAYYFGAGDAKLDAHGYLVKVRSEHYVLDMSVSVTAQGCIPVGETVAGVARGGQYRHKTV